MKKSILTFILIFLYALAFGQEFSYTDEDAILQRFPTLKILEDYNSEEIKVFYSEKYVTKLEISDDELETTNDHLLFKFNDVDNAYIATFFYYGPRIRVNNKTLGLISQTHTIIITESGYIYVYGKFGDYYVDIVEKFVIENNTIRKIEQPLYSIERESTTNCDFYIKAEPSDSADNVALISKDSDIFVIGVKHDEKGDDWVLVKSVLGLTGWVKVFMTGWDIAAQGIGFLPMFSTLAVEF